MSRAVDVSQSINQVAAGNRRHTTHGFYIMSFSNRTSESELALAVLNVLGQMPRGQATYEELRKVIPYYVMLTEHDSLPSLTREGEALL